MYFLVILGYHMKNIEKRHGTFNFAFRKMKCLLLLGTKFLQEWACIICMNV